MIKARCVVKILIIFGGKCFSVLNNLSHDNNSWLNTNHVTFTQKLMQCLYCILLTMGMTHSLSRENVSALAPYLSWRQINHQLHCNHSTVSRNTRYIPAEQVQNRPNGISTSTESHRFPLHSVEEVHRVARVATNTTNEINCFISVQLSDLQWPYRFQWPWYRCVLLCFRLHAGYLKDRIVRPKPLANRKFWVTSQRLATRLYDCTDIGDMLFPPMNSMSHFSSVMIEPLFGVRNGNIIHRLIKTPTQPKHNTPSLLGL